MINNPKLLLGSEWVSTDTTHDIVDPYTGELVAQVPVGDKALLKKAIDLAHATFALTRRQAPYERAALLHDVAAGIEKYRTDFVDLLIREAGKPLTLAHGEVTRAATTFQVAAEAARHSAGEVLDLDAYAFGKNHLGLTRRFPIGVIAGITPFNFPLNLVAHKVAPCLATGNTMLLKPAAKTPLCSLLLGQVLLEAGMIPGQVNIITCSNEDAALLSSDPFIKMVSFTGSPQVGWKLKGLCEKKKVCLELGGNAAVVVHDDANISSAVSAIATGAFAYAGQSCISVQRIFVQRSIYNSFKENFIAHVRTKIKTGNPRDAATVIGPMINVAASERILSWINAALQSGATLLHGGKMEGSCLPATILENVDHAQDIYAQEAFAPVVTLEPYDTFEQALDLVNDSDFGLQVGIFTQDLSRSLQAFQTCDVGGVLINNVPTFRVENMPYGGIKDSGFGREGVRYTMEEMTELKSLIINSP